MRLVTTQSSIEVLIRIAAQDLRNSNVTRWLVARVGQLPVDIATKSSWSASRVLAVQALRSRGLLEVGAIIIWQKGRCRFVNCSLSFGRYKPSPLSNLLSRHEEFFNLFKTFEGYVNFFLLQDLLRDSKVKFFSDQEVPFSRRPAQSNPDEYLVYASRSMGFVANRNARIHSLR